MLSDTKNWKVSSKSQISHSSVIINSDKVVIEDDVIVEDEVILNCKNIFIGAGSVIKKGTKIYANMLHLGKQSKIDEECFLRGPGDKPAELVWIGDSSYLGRGINSTIPKLAIGDYCVLHHSTVINGYTLCTLGHNSYVGQYCLLNATEDLIIGNNVRIGTTTLIFTHVISGELLEGTTFFAKKPVVIEDSVWVVGGNVVISPGITIAKYSVIMAGSVLTKSTLEKHCYGGVPATDITHKLNPWKDVSIDEKYLLMQSFAKEFCLAYKQYEGLVIFAENIKRVNPINKGQANIVIIKNGEIADLGDMITVISLETKRYIKKATQIEFDFLKFNVGYRARFIPIDDQFEGVVKGLIHDTPVHSDT